MRLESYTDIRLVLDAHSRCGYRVRVLTVSMPFIWLTPFGALADIDAVEVICSEGGVALGALPLTRVIARLDALEAEDVVALCQHSVLHPGVAAGTR